ncbi:MAG: hypothetical protein AB6733_09145 [Clostridiaceae bacterium]
MKGKVITATILILIVFVFLVFKPTKKFMPLFGPKINVTYNQNKIETVKGDYNWFDKETGGNSYMADTSTNLAKNIKGTNVKSGEKIEFSFSSFWKQPSKTRVALVASDNSASEIGENTRYFNAPKEKGEYIYLISGYWDDTHCIGYVIKINVE